MRHLMLLRHAKTERDSPTGKDRDRRLSSIGRADAPALARYVGREALLPDFTLVSPAVRARETWELFAGSFSAAMPYEIVQDLYGADSAELLQIVRSASLISDTGARLMVVAHNPGLHEFALALTGHGNADARAALADNLPTCGLATIAFKIADWPRLSFRSGHLERLITPAMLRDKPDEG